MEQRPLGSTGRDVSVVGLGTWQLGGDWGEVAEQDAFDVLDAAIDAGITFFDTADVYGDGRSERLIGRYLASRPDVGVTVATKMGRRAPLDPAEYTEAAFRAWVDRSRRNLGTDRLDLTQLHCPPGPVYTDDRVFDALDGLVDEGLIGAYGVSVETTEQALQAIARPGVQSVQIILNAFRQKPLERVLPAAVEASVAVVARVPLASGLLSGRYTRDTRFAPDDHRTFNRHGQAFDVGETFAGVDYDSGVQAAQEFAALVTDGELTAALAGAGEATPAQAALRWILQQPGVTTVIPGARSAEQVRANAAAASRPPLRDDQLAGIATLYDARIRALVHDRW